MNRTPPIIDTDLTRLFAPRVAALVGATDHPTSFCGRVFRQRVDKAPMASKMFLTPRR